MTHVHILLAAYNGAAYLQDQLESYLQQNHQDWSLWVSDDGSHDATRKILKQFQQTHPDRNIQVIPGPKQGLFANFMHLLRHPALPAGYVALSDQDDVWLPHHLENAVQQLQGIENKAFYCATTVLTDAQLQPLRPVPPPLPATSFHNAMVQNVVAGNTIVLNPQALQLIRNDPPPPSTLPYHDWWLYLRLTAAGADLICDPNPSLLYRQHGGNSLGNNKTGRLRRLRTLFNGTYGRWVSSNLMALMALPPHTLLPEYRQAAETLLHRHPRYQALRQSRARRSDTAGQLLLPILALIKRI
ncbi:glycosyltransferase [Cognatishimia sp. WU-CL00825]|uniref:glycosyltransferase n=1 Tax=Cognatishimia sp. WU-CL00825 TaxID=3127658 RepID=UPI003365A818